MVRPMQLIRPLTSTLQALPAVLVLMLCHQANASMLVGNGGGAFGGLSLTPVAQIDTGVMTAQYQNRVIGTGRYEGLNLTNVFGLSDFLEVGGRIASNSTSGNMYSGNLGIRDLSFSAKSQINPLLGLANIPLKVAFGASDIGGAATLFRAYYVVAGYAQENWQSSLGYAKGGRDNLAFNPLNGAFANGSYAIKPWLNLHLEATTKNTWAAVGFQDEKLMPSWGAPPGTTAYMRINTQVRGTNIVGGKPWVDVGLRMPLDWSEIKGNKPSGMGTSTTRPLQQPAPSSFSVPVPSSVAASAPQPVQIIGQAPASGPKEALANYIQTLSDKLLQSGFEGVSIGIIGDMLIVKASDMVYEHSLLDGAGVALGRIAQNLPEQINQYRYIHARWGTPAIGFTGDVRCLKDWLERGLKCYPMDAVQPVFRDLQKWTDEVPWAVYNRQDIRFKPRVKVNPVQNYYVATEFSLLDYSVGVQVLPSMLLWDGGSLEASQVYHIKSTTGYKPGEIFNFTRVRDGVNGIMLTHMQKFSGGLSGRFNLGQIGTGFYKGGHAELRWDSNDGELAAGFNQGYWKSSNPVLQTVGHPTSVYARYAPSQKDWSLEVIAGRYWYGDKGLSVISNHWMGDVKLSMYLRRSVPPERFWPGQFGATFAGLDITFPLTPRRAMNNEYVQVKGSSRIGLSLSTPVGRKDNYIVDPFGIPIYIRALVDSPVAAHLGSVLMDYDRNRASYVSGHLERLRYAYETWVKEN
jgi:hypothetical protein